MKEQDRKLLIELLDADDAIEMHLNNHRYKELGKVYRQEAKKTLFNTYVLMKYQSRNRSQGRHKPKDKRIENKAARMQEWSKAHEGLIR